MLRKRTELMESINWVAIFSEPLTPDYIEAVRRDIIEYAHQLPLNTLKPNCNLSPIENQVRQIQKLCQSISSNLYSSQMLKNILELHQGALFSKKPEITYKNVDPEKEFWKTFSTFNHYRHKVIRWYEFSKIFGTDICFILNPRSKKSFATTLGLYTNEKFETLIQNIKMNEPPVECRSKFSLDELMNWLSMNRGFSDDPRPLNIMYNSILTI